MLEGLINADKQIVLGVDSLYTTPDGEETFEGESKGIAIGDNSTNQTVIVGEGTKDFEYTLAHELSHAYRGIYELRNEDSEGVNEDEEGYAILAENQIRYETGGELRRDGDSRADVDGDGKGDGDGSYGQIEGEELTLEWLFERSKGAKAASGTILNFANKKSTSKSSSSKKKASSSSSKKSSSSSKKSTSSSSSKKSSSSSSKTSAASKVKNAVSKAVSTVKNAVTKAATAVKTAVSTATSKATTSTSKKNETPSSKSTASTTKTSSSSSNGGGKNKNDKGATSSMSGGKNKAGSSVSKTSSQSTGTKTSETKTVSTKATTTTASDKSASTSKSNKATSKTTGNPRKQLTEGAKAIIADNKDGIHTALDTAGIFVPAADAVNAALYSLEGNVTMAALSSVAVIPLAGEAAKGGKLLKNVAESSTDLKTVAKAADKVTKALSKKTKKTYKIQLAEAAETAGKKADEVVKDGALFGPNAEDLKMSQTVQNHMNDIIKKGPNAGQLSRPYIDSDGTTLLLNEIMQSGVPVPDAILQSGLRWDASGTFRGSTGTWELVVDTSTNTVVHFNFIAQ